MPEGTVPEGTVLVLVTRRGCCLCEGLAERLASLGPALPLPVQAVDVDGDPVLLVRYDVEVPVLLLRQAGRSDRLLPRVPPRLAGDRLVEWLRDRISGSKTA